MALTIKTRNFKHFSKQLMIDWLNLQVSPDTVYPQLGVLSYDLDADTVTFYEEENEAEVDSTREYTITFTDLIDTILDTNDFVADDIVDITSYDQSTFTVEY